MKYLKLFENFNVYDIIQNLKDICLELNDEGIQTECEHNEPNKKYAPLPGQRENISVGLERESSGDMYQFSDELKWSDINDVIFRMIDYMNDSGWKPSYVIIDLTKPFHQIGDDSRWIETVDAKEYLSNHFKDEWVFTGLKIDFIRI
jgi:hypothetical protein